MSLDTPARIAILGAGPTGIEAALYGRFLGYDVDLYERGRVAENLLQLGPRPLSVPWRLVPSPLGVAALEAQDATWRPPAADAVLTCDEIVARYYSPLANSDLLADSVRTQTTVVAVSREGPTGDVLAREELRGDEARADGPFRIVLRNASGEEQLASADAVIDCTGIDGADDSLSVQLQTELLKPEDSSANRPQRLLRVEPDFYVLGAKSIADGEDFTFADGLVQVRDVFTILGDRATLDLYAGFPTLR
jgi:hypothetical protein